MTRDSDVFVPLEKRADIANATPNCIFVSLHLNATDWNPAAAGFEIYSLTPRAAPSTADNAMALRFFEMQSGSAVDAPSLALSMSVYHSIVGQLAEFDRGIKRARFAVLRRTRVPAILVEGGFLTERDEGRLIADSKWRAKYAQAIATGIDNYKLLVDRHQRPMMLADYHRQLSGTLIARDATQPAPMNEAAAIIPASNTQGRTSEESLGQAQPRPSATEIANELAHEDVAVEVQPQSTVTPAPAIAEVQQPTPTVLEEQMPNDSPEISAPTLSPIQRVSSSAMGNAILSDESYARRLLRWVPALPHLLPNE
jgi:hypothetical protein